TTINTRYNDAVVVGAAPTASLDAIQGPVTVSGQGGWFGALNIEDQAATHGRSYTFTSNALSWGSPTAQINFSFLDGMLLDAANGGDAVTVRSMPAVPTTLHGGGHGPNLTNTIVGPDTRNTWLFNGATDAVGGLNGSLVFEFFDQVRGGAAQDVFVFADGHSTRARLDGGGGMNWLNYSAYRSAV